MNTRVRIIIVFLAIWLLISRDSISFPPIFSPPSEKITSVDYIYERDLTDVPREVSDWLREVNDKTEIEARTLDKDTVDPSGKQRPSILEAKRSGIPSLVAMSGEKVVRVVLNPQKRSDLAGVVPELSN